MFRFCSWIDARIFVVLAVLGLGIWGLNPPTGAAQQVGLLALEESDVSATDGAFEDRVEVTWPALGSDSASYEIQIYRDTTTDGRVDDRGEARIGLASSDDSLFTDTGGDPGVTYEYCIVAADGSTEDGPYCDSGSRVLSEPVNVRATDRTETGQVRLSWGDRSTVEDGYRVERNGASLLRTGPGAQQYLDTMQTMGNVAVDYVETDSSAIPAFGDAGLSGVTDRFGLVSTPRESRYALRLRSQVRVREQGTYTFDLIPTTQDRCALYCLLCMSGLLSFVGEDPDN